MTNKVITNIVLTILIILIILIIYFKTIKKEQFTNKHKFGVMWASTTNIGDDIQTLAAVNLLKKNGINDHIFIDRENLSSYDGDHVVLIMNGWYIHNLNSFPPSNKITPIFIGVHINNEDLVKNNTTYFKKYQPIGCRDTDTVTIFKKYNIGAYFSGCLTLTFDEYNQKSSEIYLVDVDDHTYDINKNKEVTVINHTFDIKKKDDLNFRLKFAQDLLNKYKKAKLVITSRLHCALPCRALNTDVKFIYQYYDNDPRFSGLKEILQGDSSDIDKASQSINRNIINNFKNKIRSDFRNRIQSFL